MMRWDGFGRTLGFGLAAAAGLPVAVTFAGPWLAAPTTAGLYLLGVAAAYAWGLGEGRARRRAALALAAGAGALLAALPLGLPGMALGAAAAIALCRSGVHHRQAPLRALALELVLGAAGLGLAAFLASGGLRSLAVAIWGYFLVQSAYFLVGGRRARGEPGERDPFERARAQIERLELGQEPR